LVSRLASTLPDAPARRRNVPLWHFPNPIPCSLVVGDAGGIGGRGRAGWRGRESPLAPPPSSLAVRGKQSRITRSVAVPRAIRGVQRIDCFDVRIHSPQPIATTDASSGARMPRPSNPGRLQRSTSSFCPWRARVRDATRSAR
jgi:hypothetical protein